MLMDLREALPEHRKKLMDIYRESNEENIAYFFPGCERRREGTGHGGGFLYGIYRGVRHT